MSETTAAAAGMERPRQDRRTPDGRWAKGTSGRPPGILDKRSRFTKEALEVAARHVPSVLEAALTARSVRLRFDATAWLCEMLLGRPRQSLDVVGGLGDLASELALALADVRSRRAALPAVHVVEASRGRPVDEIGQNRPPIEALPISTERIGDREAPPSSSSSASSSSSSCCTGASENPDEPRRTVETSGRTIVPDVSSVSPLTADAADGRVAAALAVPGDVEEDEA